MCILAGLLYLPYSLVLGIGVAVVLGSNFLTGSPMAESIYPVLPWPGLIALGFCFGSLYTSGLVRPLRQTLISILSCCCCWMFIMLGYINGYKEPLPTLLPVMASLSIVFFLSALFEGKAAAVVTPLTVFGRVPLFFYLLHFSVIRLVLLFLPAIASWPVLLFAGLLVLWLCYPLCRWYGRYKQRNAQLWWVSYL
jgi:uncharacterized membrane protein